MQSRKVVLDARGKVIGARRVLWQFFVAPVLAAAHAPGSRWLQQHHPLHRRLVPRGLEPRTLRLLAVRSDQLSYETL